MARGPKASGLQGVALWALVTALLAFGLLTTLVDFGQLAAKEGKRAQLSEQRFVVNAVSGEVLMGSGEAEKPKAPEVAVKEADAAAQSAPPAEETSMAEAPPQATPVAESQPEASPAPPETESQPEASPTPAAETAELKETAATPAEKAAAAPEKSPAAPVASAEGADQLRTQPLEAKLTAPTPGKESLVAAPAPEVSESVDGVTLPKRGDKDITPAQLYAHPFKRKDDQAIISFVVLNAGLDPQSIGLILGMPSAVTVAYSPYIHSEKSYSENLRDAGHEVWTMLPTMSDHYPNDDPGPFGILGHMPPEESIRRIHEILAVIPGSVGLVLPPDEAVSLQKETLSPVLGELSTRGLLLLSTHPTRNIDQITHNAGLAEMIRRADLMLDPSPNESKIKSNLAGVLESAKEKGTYVVVLSARPQSLEILSEWLKETKLDEEHYVLAPLSAAYQPKTAPEVAKPAEGEAKPDKSKKPQANKKPKILPQDQYRTPPGKDSKPAEAK